MKASDLAKLLLLNPDAIVSAWDAATSRQQPISGLVVGQDFIDDDETIELQTDQKQ